MKKGFLLTLLSLTTIVLSGCSGGNMNATLLKDGRVYKYALGTDGETTISYCRVSMVPKKGNKYTFSKDDFYYLNGEAKIYAVGFGSALGYDGSGQIYKINVQYETVYERLGKGEEKKLTVIFTETAIDVQYVYYKDVILNPEIKNSVTADIEED